MRRRWSLPTAVCRYHAVVVNREQRHGFDDLVDQRFGGGAANGSTAAVVEIALRLAADEAGCSSPRSRSLNSPAPSTPLAPRIVHRG